MWYSLVLFWPAFPYEFHIFVSLMMPEKLIFSHVRKPHLSKHRLRKILQKHPALAPKPRVGFEAEVMQKLQHPNIVTLGFWWKQKDTNTSYILPLSLALVGSSQNIYIYIRACFFFTTWNWFFFVFRGFVYQSLSIHFGTATLNSVFILGFQRFQRFQPFEISSYTGEIFIPLRKLLQVMEDEERVLTAENSYRLLSQTVLWRQWTETTIVSWAVYHRLNRKKLKAISGLVIRVRESYSLGPGCIFLIGSDTWSMILPQYTDPQVVTVGTSYWYLESGCIRSTDEAYTTHENI